MDAQIILLKKLIVVLTAIVALLQARHLDNSITPPKKFGASPPSMVSVTPSHIVGMDLYDTPSGSLDIGYYSTTTDDYYAHVDETVLATTTRPAGFYPIKKGFLAHKIGTRYTFYDENNNVLGTSIDQNIEVQIHTKDAPLPTIDVLQ